MAESEVKLSEGQITPKALEDWKKRIGVSLRIGNIFNEMASKDNIRKFVNGIGDPNPLYRDPEYAKTTRYGGLVAPPSFLYSIYPTWVLQGLAGVHGFHAGNDWEIYRPIKENDIITPECIFTGFDEKSSEFAGKLVMENQEARFTNQHGELIAKAGVWIVRAERKAARDAGKYSKLTLPHPWKEEELEKVEADCLAEEVRGSNPRYWEDVNVGDELKPVIKGPLGITDIIAFCVGSSPIEIKAHGMALRLYRAHPAWAFRDPATGSWEPVYGVHYNKAAANFAGLPYAYDVGVQRNCWLLHLLTNWIGDDGWIKRSYAEYRKFVYLSDAVYVKGKVTKKYFDDNGEACVDVDTCAINQRGEDTMPGNSTLVLPSRDKGTWPAQKRLS